MKGFGQAVMAHAFNPFNPGTQEAEALQARWGYTGKSCLGRWGGGGVYFGLRFQVAGVAWHGGRSSKLANHVVSIHRKRRGQTGSGDSL